jgi:hypothetical protein
MKNKLVWHEIFLFGLAMILVLWKVLTGRIGFDIYLLWWLLGLVLGFLFIFLDRLVYGLYTHKEEFLSVQIRKSFKEKKWAEGFSLLVNERQEQKELVMRSFLFVGIWMVMSVFALTSSISYFARGFMAGIGTHLVFDLVSDYMWNKSRFDLWFWQIKRKIGEDEKKWFLGITVLIYVLLISGL